jgi:hypothetical protein
MLTPSLRQCQIDTPKEIVEFVWEKIAAVRSKVENVLDLGAGEGDFAMFGDYAKYVGYEIDARRVLKFSTTKYRVLHADALDVEGSYDAAVGNPPYIRNQDLNEEWRARAVSLIEGEASIQVDLRANLYVYFMWLSLLRTTKDGLVALIVPADWLVRPSAQRFRDYLTDQSWHTSIFLFQDAKSFFPNVKTNLTLTLIDKASSEAWRYYSVANDLTVSEVPALARRLKPFPKHRRRANGVRAGRGLSPGAQSTFVLTEAQRKASGIARSAVVPCVTSLRSLPRTLTTLTEATFTEFYVDAGRPCWLLRTSQSKVSKPVLRWLAQTPKHIRNNGTCGGRETWYRYALPTVPNILYTSGFRSSPLFLVNDVGARAVGAVHGVFDSSNAVALASRLRAFDFKRSRFRHARELLKLEVSQMNLLLERLSRGLTTREKGKMA